MIRSPFSLAGRREPAGGREPARIRCLFYRNRPPLSPARGLGLAPVRIHITDASVEVLLSRWEKVLGLMRDIRVPRADVSDVRVVADPMAEAMGSGIKVGLRLPWLLYVARTIRLDQVFVVRRRTPGLSFAVANREPLRRVLLSTPEAEQLARRLGAS
jgi:hypothetical protein